MTKLNPVLPIATVSLFLMAFPCMADGNKDEAANAFQEGIELFDNGDFKQAALAFRRANELNFNWRILYNIGQSEASSKQYGLALEAFEAYLAHAGDDIDFTRRDEVLSEIQRLKLMVGAIEVTAPAGTLIFVDGELRGEAPMAGPILVPSGLLHVIEIRDQTAILMTRKIKLNSGQTSRITIPESNHSSPNSVAAAPESPDPVPQSTVTTRPIGATGPPIDANVSRGRSLGIAFIALGGAAVIGGAVTGIMAMKRGKQLESDYPNGVPDSETDRRKSVDTLARTTDILIGVGIVSAVAGTILLVRNRKHRTATAHPVFGPGMAGLQLEGRF